MRYRIAMIAVVGTLAACVFPTDSCACILVPPSAIVFGTVETTTGSPLAGAVVEVRIFNRSCNGPISSVNVFTGNDGRYRSQLMAPANTDSACVDVVARDLSGDSTAVRGGKVRIADPADSVRVDLKLSGGAG